MVSIPACGREGLPQNGSVGWLCTWAGSLGVYCLGVLALGLLAAGLVGPGVRAEPPKELSEGQRKQLVSRAAELYKQALQLHQQGQYADAIKLLEQVLVLGEQFYPKDEYPQGHPDLAKTFVWMAALLDAQKEYPKALVFAERALAMRETLYPQGHPDLANSLAWTGRLLLDQREYSRALPYLERALAMREALYPKNKYPQGHPDLAHSLGHLGSLFQAREEYPKALIFAERELAMREALYPQGHPDLAKSLAWIGFLFDAQREYQKALPYYERALAMREALYPKDKYPQGHADLATSLSSLGDVLLAQAEYARALPYRERALAMCEALYPKDKYPQGHPELARSLNSLGFLFRAQGEYARALPYFEQALAMNQRLYPKDGGHPDLAASLNNLGSLLSSQGERADALPYMKRALTIYEQLYPEDRFPQGHSQLARMLTNLGAVLDSQGEHARALPYYERALAMCETLYPKDKYPQGHPDLARSLNNLGVLFGAQGEYARAQPYYERALAMREALYPKDKYPHGHPDLAEGLANLARSLFDRREYARALPYLERASEMRQDLSYVFVAGASEAEALNFAASFPLTRDGFLTVSAQVPGKEDASYAHLWRSKAAFLRILQRWQQKFLQTADPEQLAVWKELLATRRELSRLLLTPGSDQETHRQRLQKLTRQKEELERKLAEQLPESRRQLALQRLPHTELIKQLPPGTVFVDLFRYVRFEQNPKVAGKAGEKRTLSYVAFVLCPSQPVQRVELGPAQPIDAAVVDWRQDIADQKSSPSAETLRRLVWEPLAKHLPAQTETIYLAPDGALTRLPWAALPGRTSGTVLLEEYLLAVVPHGPFLLDRLTAKPGQAKDPGLLLAVGGVRYDREPEPIKEAKDGNPLARLAERGGKALSWNYLSGTEKELDKVTELAGKRPVRGRRGTEASTAQVLLDLPQARWAHLATHGFFADERLCSVMQTDEKLFEYRGILDRATPGARNPMVLSGLVLAGANLPLPKDARDLTHSDGGILTAEVIAGLPLHSLELAVLSACETGLGEVAGGEGVFGLQRAFHMAGAHNVVASLWKVNDEATAALMALFYHKLWREQKPPLVALREAQLYLYRHPDRIGDLARLREPDFAKVMPLPPDPPSKPGPSDKAPTKAWAAFVLSGTGQ